MKLQANRKGAARKYNRDAICYRCGKEFERYPGKQKNKRTFCSRECYNLQLGEENLQRRVNQTGGLTFEERKKIRESRLGTGEGKSYKKYFSRHEHRVIAERKLGRKLKPGEVVHHIDGNRRNNKPDNLMVFPNASEHLTWHKENDPRFQVGGDPFHG